MGRLTTIEAKPEQSKHLETATARVCDLSVDWVQQRGQEVYTEGSRIPTVVRFFSFSSSLLPPPNPSHLPQAFGTPLEDAERRDLTINALFYNLRTRQIEDCTGLGLADLGLLPVPSSSPDSPPIYKRMIRTPLPPFKTFRDDPLRVVRAVRFAARFGREFELEAGMVEAIQREEIRVRSGF
jgi:tRNA nucleotidyltransferase (CCA-adding enzyme)